jgi:hypothetical protein
MTCKLATAAGALVLMVIGSAVEAGQRQGQAPGGVLTPFEQQMVDAQLADRHLAATTITGLKLSATPVKDVLEAIGKAGGVTLSYDATAANLDKPTTVNVQSTTVEDALLTVASANGLAFTVTGKTAAWIYADTAANREKYKESIRTFKIVNADLQVLMTTINRALTGTSGPRPSVVSGKESRTITVRATPDRMTQIAKLIADNDK